MKALDTNNLTDADTSNDAFSKAVENVKEEAKTIQKKSYTLTKANIEYITNLAKQLAKENKSSIVSASEALRVIVKEHEEGAR